jgi:hypothetical protein
MKTYWQPIIDLCDREEISTRARIAGQTCGWGRTFVIPSPNYLELFAGPVPARTVEWVELSTIRVIKFKGGRVEVRRIEGLEAAEELVGVPFELVDAKWDEPAMELKAIRVPNPLFRSHGSALAAR